MHGIRVCYCDEVVVYVITILCFLIKVYGPGIVL